MIWGIPKPKGGDRDSDTIFTDILYLILDFHLDREFTIQYESVESIVGQL